MSRKERWSARLPFLSGELRRAMEFLRDHLPDSDLDCYPFPLFLRFARHALALREQAPWCGALEWEIFAHYVLFPRVNDEDLSFHRRLFHRSLWPRVRDLPGAGQQVLEVNRWCCEHASYQAQDERTASPLTVYRCGSGRCGEESAFLVSALRSVGIAARQVYAPRWAHCGDNHAWVEALCDGTWHFLGACEPEPVLDRGWFNTAASRAVLVHSRLFGPGSSPLHGEPLGRDGGVYWYNQTPRYAQTRTVTLRALAQGRPAAGARIEVQLLNDGFFHTIAVLTAGEDGCAQAELGLGSVHVLASLGPLAAEGDCDGAELTLPLAPARRVTRAGSALTHMPPPRTPPAPARSPRIKSGRGPRSWPGAPPSGSSGWRRSTIPARPAPSPGGRICCAGRGEIPARWPPSSPWTATPAGRPWPAPCPPRTCGTSAAPFLKTICKIFLPLPPACRRRYTGGIWPAPGQPWSR